MFRRLYSDGSKSIASFPTTVSSSHQPPRLLDQPHPTTIHSSSSLQQPQSHKTLLSHFSKRPPPQTHLTSPTSSNRYAKCFYRGESEIGGCINQCGGKDRGFCNTKLRILYSLFLHVKVGNTACVLIYVILFCRMPAMEMTENCHVYANPSYPGHLEVGTMQIGGLPFYLPQQHHQEESSADSPSKQQPHPHLASKKLGPSPLVPL